jgi:predicted DNA-binding transcriptional regulator AlpA
MITPVVYRDRLRMSPGVIFWAMAPVVDTDDLIDAHAVAAMIGLSHRNTVSVYQKRYPDMPRPVVDLGKGRPQLWLRSEIEQWGRSRPGRD